MVLTQTKLRKFIQKITCSVLSILITLRRLEASDEIFPGRFLPTENYDSNSNSVIKNNSKILIKAKMYGAYGRFIVVVVNCCHCEGILWFVN